MNMHELPVIEKILNIVEKQAKMNSLNKILSLTLETGALSDLEPEWLNYYFRKICRNTILQDTKLKIFRQKAFFQCRDCDHNWSYSLKTAENCPLCRGRNIELKADSHYTLKEIEGI